MFFTSAYNLTLIVGNGCFVQKISLSIVSGLHNWIRFLYLEKNKNNFHFDYKGYLIKRGWEDLMKPAGSFLIGTTPEFEFALYTFCFLSRRLNGKGKNCNVGLN
uniref:Endoribonuclease n=1 Tax=Meloidogyne incognita TaxID=6306 RepID=A0A914NQZ3_MELIC